MKKPECTVLTFIFGKNYETLRELEQKTDGIEYILVTDDEDLKSSTWNVVVDHDLDGLPPFEKCFRVRYNPFKYCSSDVCMMIDGSIHMKKFPHALLEKFNDGKYDICLMPHPFWADFCKEYSAWIQMRGYDANDARKFFNFLHTSNYDPNYLGLFQLNFTMRRRTKLTDDIDQMTWAFIKYLSTEEKFERLDQTIFTFVMNRYFNNIKVLPVSEQILHDNDFMQLHWHATWKKNDNKGYDPSKPDMKYMFNKLVECTYI